MKQSNKNLILQMLDSIASALPIALAFLIPLFFLPNTMEFYAFNKLALITIATLLLVVIWVVKTLTGEDLRIVKSKMDLPIWLFTIVVILSTVFSIDKTRSLYGSQGKWIGLISLLVLVAYYYISTPLLSTKKSIKFAIYAFVTSATVSTILALFSYYGIYLGSATYFRTPTFSPSGNLLAAVFLASLAVVTSLALMLSEKNQKIKIGLIAGLTINFLYVALTGTILGWVLVLSGILGLTLISNKQAIANSKLSVLISTGILGLITLLMVIPGTRGVFKNENFPISPRLPVQESWRVATSVVQNDPFLATGPGTFDLTYPSYKPLSMNNTPWWDVRFDTAYSEVFNILATLGLLGVVGAIFFAFRVYKFIYDNKQVEDESGIIRIISVMLFTTVISYVFMPANILNSFILFFALSLMSGANVIIHRKQKFTETVSVGVSSLTSSVQDSDQMIGQEYYKYVVSIIMLGITAFIGYSGYKVYMGEFYMRQSIEAALSGNGNMTYEYQRRAININPRRDLYHNTYAQTNLALANSIAARENLTDTDRQTIQSLIAQAIRTTRVATEVVTPISPSNWETRATIYRSIINIAENAVDWTLGAYTTAIRLDPANPRLRLELGGVLYSQGDYLSAANQFRQATALKPDYANAYYNFAQALIELDDLQNAKRALEITKTLVSPDSEDFAKVDGQLAIINQNLESVAGAATDRPTVEEIAGIETTPENQEPLTNAAEQQQIENDNLDVGALPAPAEETPQEEAPQEEEAPEEQE